jgi:hypothetical protein
MPFGSTNRYCDSTPMTQTREATWRGYGLSNKQAFDPET